MALADVDGDGDLDIVQANYYYSYSALLLNDGSAHFTQNPAFPSVYAVSVAGRATSTWTATSISS